MPPAPAAPLLDEARRIGRTLAEGAVAVRGGSVTWLREEGGGARPLPPHLYGGTAGIALFLAALGHLDREGDARSLAVRALAPLAARLRALAADPGAAAALRLGVGGLTGLGSFVYALARAGAWTGEASLLEGARAGAALLTPERIAADRALDVVDGCAGAVLALLALDRLDPASQGGGPAPLERARLCGLHLLRTRTPGRGGTRAWPGEGTPPLGGFAHGASGIALALLALHHRTGDRALRDAALEGLAYEEGLFDPELGNWTDLRTGRPLEQSAWCHGAPGIALARAAAVELEPAGPFRPALERTLALARALPEAPLDHLCCGNAGRADVLLHAGRAAGDAEAVEAGLRLASAIVPADGEYRLRPPPAPRELDPSLFRGISGIGYTLLRAANPGALPSLLLLA